MSLVARVTLTGAADEDDQSPENLMFSALGVIFTDDITNQHGDADHGVLYTSPNLPEPLHLSVTDPAGEADRKLFSHFVWNSSLLLAKLVEAGTLLAAAQVVVNDDKATGIRHLLGSGPATAVEEDPVVSEHCPITNFDVVGKTCVELGAGTALPSIMAALLGAKRVAITDYPTDVVLENLRANLARNVKAAGSSKNKDFSEPTGPPTKNPASSTIVSVDGHEWGQFDTDIAQGGHHAYDRVFVCDCLWMPWQHDNLRRSIDWFLKKEDQDARCWVIGGFHTGRPKVAAFFDEEALAELDLEIEAIWERDCDDQERPWSADRGIEDAAERKRWLVVAILRRKQMSTPISG